MVSSWFLVIKYSTAQTAKLCSVMSACQKVQVGLFKVNCFVKLSIKSSLIVNKFEIKINYELLGGHDDTICTCDYLHTCVCSYNNNNSHLNLSMHIRCSCKIKQGKING